MVLKTSLSTANSSYNDIEIWTETEGLPRLLQYVTHINHQKVPIFLVSHGPFRVYSQNSMTEQYFGQNIACYQNYTGILAKSTNEDVYAVFFGDQNLEIWSYFVDFSIVDLFQLLAEKDVNCYYTGVPTVMSRSNTAIFDRVLENKVGNTKKPTAPRQMPPLMLSTTHQISQAVNKMVLSALRLRGLTTSGNSNEMVAVREIYHMTRKAAMFSLRKYHYNFNGSKREDANIQMEDIQDVVERLLEVFLDVESTTASGK